METVADFFWGAPKSLQTVNAAKKLRHLLPGRKAKTNLDIGLKSRDMTLPTKVCIVKAKVFPIVMYGCESWTIKKAECQRTDAEDEAPVLWPPDVKSEVTGKTLIPGKIDGRRRRGRLRRRLLDGIIDSMDMILSKLGEIVNNREGWCVLSCFSHV